MTIRRTFLSMTLLAAACSPSAFVPLPGSDTGPTTDGAVDRPAPVDAVDATAADAVAVDVPSVDIGMIVDAGAVDVTPSTDVPSVVDAATSVDAIDVPVTTDTPAAVDVPDVPSVVDAGTCPTGMALIPGGTFTMGDSGGLSSGAQPTHVVTLSTYCMDLTEVTVAAYTACTATGCTAPNTGTSCNWGVAGRGNHPINCVDWFQERAYCQSRGGDLPTEAQWEYAARGSDGRAYAWGNDAPVSQLCWSGSGARLGTCPVQSFPSGNSPFGLFDMGGNVWEMTLDWYGVYSSSPSSNPTGPTMGMYRSGRGGSWQDTLANNVHAAYRGSSGTSYRVDIVGFRCARAPL